MRPGNRTEVDLAVDVVIPLRVEDRGGVSAAFLLVQTADFRPQEVAHLEVRLRLIPRLDCLVAPLQPTTGVQDGTRLLVDERAGEEVHGRLDLGRVHVRSLPEGRRLGFDLVGHDEPIEVRHRAAHVAGVRGRVAGVHTPVEVALDDALLHELERGDMRVVLVALLGGNLRPPVVAVVVLDGCGIAEPLLEGGHDELRLVSVVAGGIRLGFQPLAQAGTIGGVCPLQVSRMLVHHHAHVGCTLNIGLAAQSVHTAAGDTDVAEEQLHNAHSARILGAIRVLRLAQCVEHHAGTTGLCGGTVGGVHQLERFLVHAADVAYGVEGVALVVLLHLLVDAHRVLKRHVALGEGERRRGELGNAVLLNPGVVAQSGGVPVLFLLGLIMPRMVGVGLGLLVPTGVKAGFGVEVELGVEQVRRVGVVEQVLVVVVAHLTSGEVLLKIRIDQVLDDPVIHAAVEGDVRARTDGAVDIRLLSSTGIAGIDDDPLRSAVMGLAKPQRADRVVLNGVGTAVEDDVGVLKVAPVARHRAATK